MNLRVVSHNVGIVDSYSKSEMVQPSSFQSNQPLVSFMHAITSVAVTIFFVVFLHVQERIVVYIAVEFYSRLDSPNETFFRTPFFRTHKRDSIIFYQ